MTQKEGSDLCPDLEAMTFNLLVGLFYGTNCLTHF